MPHGWRAPLLVGAVAALVVVTSAVPRTLASMGLLPPPWLVFGWSDVAQTWTDSGLAGRHLPYRDVPFAYPPVVGYLAGALSLLSDGFRTYFIAWTAVTAIAAAGAATLLARAAGTRRSLAYWALTPQLLLLGAINFDVLAAAIVSVAAIAARSRRDVGTLVAIAVGTATKLYPLAAAPLPPLRALRGGRMRDALVATGAFVVAVAVLYLPASLAPSSTLPFAAAYAYGTLTNFDSAWGVLRDLVAAAGGDLTPWIVPISLLGTAVTYVVLVVLRGSRANDPVIGFALATVTVLLWSRLYSPQYSIWLLSFFVLLALRRGTFVVLSLADVVVFFTVYPLTLLSLGPATVDALHALLIGGVILRHVALVLIARDCLALDRRVSSRAAMRR